MSSIKKNINSESPLLICLSHRWGTLERRAFKDLLILREASVAPYVMCLKDSPLHRELSGIGVEKHCLFFTKMPGSFLFNFRYAVFLYRSIQRYKVDLIQCYDISSIWGTTLALQAKLTIPLFLTVNYWGRGAEQSSYWQRLMLGRVDGLFVLSHGAKESAPLSLPLDEARVHNLGLGCDAIKIDQEGTRADTFTVSVFMPDHVRGPGRMRFLFSVVERFLKSQVNTPIHFKVIARKPMEDFAFFSLIRDEVSHYQYGGLFSWEVTGVVEQQLFNADVYWSMEESEIISDLEIQALFSGTPVLLVRSSSRQELISGGPFLGESYKYKDSREVMIKLLKLHGGLVLYQDSIKEQADELLSSHGAKNYERIYKRIFNESFSARQH